ncbi:MAG: FAD-dependent oxidoreductase [Planctomycetaceae bacterium]|nr:FAD-dependent oxidoreductase [Planctomycetaceae bacterium]
MPASSMFRLSRCCSLLAFVCSLLGAWFCGANRDSVAAELSGGTADVVVYGGTSAGVTAAIQVARMGHSVILIEPTRHIGGLTSGGLGFTDSGDKRVIGGLSREFYQRVRKHYDDAAAWSQEKPSEYARYRANEDAMWTFEPKVAEAILRQMLAEAKVTLVEQQRLNRDSGVKLDGTRIVSITMESGVEYKGRQFVDATYEGDLMAAAGVKFTVGREANSVYGETLNGNQVKANIHNHRFVKNVDPWKIPGDKSSGLLPGIESTGPGVEGTGDHRVQAYCFRMCMSNSPKNRRPFPKPEGYNEADYELLLRNFEAGDLRFPMKPDMMPNRKTDTNNNCAVSTDYLGANYDYPNATYEQRDAIIREHARYQKGLMWTLANHPRVPQKIRDEMVEWGLPLDEFTDNDNWPHQLYIREARRMVSDYVVTELDCRRERIVPDSVGLGSYNMDSHNVRRFVTEEGFVQNEGDVQVSPGGAYLISYRSIVPAKGQASNLTVPVCLSSSHIAYGSIRMEPVFMILGQSAATAAVLAMNGNMDLQDVPYAKLREQMLKDNQVLDLPPQTTAKPLVAKDKLPGFVLDNSDAKVMGVWSHSSSTGKYVGIDYLHDGDMEKGTKQALFTATVKEAGTYSIRMSYSANPNRASNVMVRAKSSGGEVSKEVNQQKVPPIDGLFVEIGEMTLKAMDEVEVSIDTAGTNGHVIIDAIQILPKP